MREELRHWNFLQFNPEMLHQPSPNITKTALSSDGSHLAGFLARITAEDPTIIKDISRDMANLVSGIRNISVEKDPLVNRYVIYATMHDDRRFPSMLLSDGTLRLLAFVTLKNDPKYQGLILFEEPENGIHASLLQRMFEMLTYFTTDFSNQNHAKFPLRQIMINTHSVVLAKYLIESNQIYSSILLAEIVTHINNELYKYPLNFTKFHLMSLNDKKSLNRIIKYLEQGSPNSTITLLESL